MLQARHNPHVSTARFDTVPRDCGTLHSHDSLPCSLFGPCTLSGPCSPDKEGIVCFSDWFEGKHGWFLQMIWSYLIHVQEVWAIFLAISHILRHTSNRKKWFGPGGHCSGPLQVLAVKSICSNTQYGCTATPKCQVWRYVRKWWQSLSFHPISLTVCPIFHHKCHYPLVIAIENGQLEIVDSPINFPWYIFPVRFFLTFTLW